MYRWVWRNKQKRLRHFFSLTRGPNWPLRCLDENREINKGVTNTFMSLTGGPNWPFRCLEVLLIPVSLNKLTFAQPLMCFSLFPCQLISFKHSSPRKFPEKVQFPDERESCQMSWDTPNFVDPAISRIDPLPCLDLLRLQRIGNSCFVFFVVIGGLFFVCACFATM